MNGCPNDGRGLAGGGKERAPPITGDSVMADGTVAVKLPNPVAAVATGEGVAKVVMKEGTTRLDLPREEDGCPVKPTPAASKEEA